MRISLLFVIPVLFVASGNAQSDTSSPNLQTPQQLAAGELNQAVEAATGAKAKATPPRPVDFTQVMNGAKLYAAHCAQCHGPRAEGVVKWRQRDADGNFPPPPLNGTAHAWHHPKRQLMKTIQNGGRTMPPFANKLSESEMSNIVDWMVSLWPDEVYALWAERNQQYETRQR